MIGVISGEKDREIIREFFELFKTPWEFYDPHRSYDVVLSTQNKIRKTNSKLLIIYSSDKRHFDDIREIRVQSKYKNASVEYHHTEIPIYGDLLTFEGVGRPVLYVKDNSEVAGLEIKSEGLRKIALGYNLFEEIDHLLSTGQPKENAHIPTLEIHISMVRSLITDAGILLIEVPPVPARYDFITCLTHDIDSWGIRNHILDDSMWGFLYRASVGSLLGVFGRRLSFRKLLKNWKAVLSLPLVYLGLTKDFWLQINTYTEIEKDLKSTFFFIPFKNRTGNKLPYAAAKRRSTKYDISDVRETVKELSEQGFEIGLHGIDAWHSLEMARQEFDRVHEYCNGSEIGVRIHWLFFNHDSYRTLESAGFSYDATFGYNEAVGYRAGTGQVFKPLTTKKLLELPLHIQDTALFYSRRMNLSEQKALHLCESLLRKANSYGGILAILWHDRSLSPERLWGDFYIKLLEEIKKYNIWFATAGQAVRWFRKRRALGFGQVKDMGDRVRLELKNDENYHESEVEPPLLIRVYPPRIRGLGNGDLVPYGWNYSDIPWRGEKEIEIAL